MALKSKPFTIRIPGELIELIELRVKELRYSSNSKYFLGLLIFDLWCRREHKLTAPLLREPQWVIDEVIEKLVKIFSGEIPPEGRATEPGYFDSLIERLVEEAKADGDPNNQANEHTETRPKKGKGR